MSGIGIPGTTYQIRDDKFVGQDGTTLTKDQFIEKVRTKEISLTGESLKFLDSRVGPDTMHSLRTAGGFLTSPRELTNKLERAELGVEQLALDMYTMLAMLVEIDQQQNKTLKEIEGREFDANINLLQMSAKKELEAGNWKVAIGIMQGIMTIAAGAANIKGAMGGTEISMQKGTGAGKIFDGLSGLAAASMQIAVNDAEQQAKNLNIEAKKAEGEMSETSDVRETFRQLHAKVLEIMREVQQAEAQVARSINSR